MAATDYTGSIYSLVVIVSATLALSSYLMNHSKSEMEATKARLQKEWKNKCKELATGETSDDDLQKEYDRIDNQRAITVDLHMRILVSLLPASALLQALNVATKAWLPAGESRSWLDLFLFFLNAIAPVLIISAYCVALVVVVLVMREVSRFRELNERMKDSVDSLIQNGIIAGKHYQRGKNGAPVGEQVASS